MALFFWRGGGQRFCMEEHVMLCNTGNRQKSSLPLLKWQPNSLVLFVRSDGVIACKDRHAGGLVFKTRARWGQAGAINFLEISSKIWCELHSSVYLKWCVRQYYRQLADATRTVWKFCTVWEKKGEKKTIWEKSWVTTISTAVPRIYMVEGLSRHPAFSGNTLVRNDGLCHSTCKRKHSWLSY